MPRTGNQWPREGRDAQHQARYDSTTDIRRNEQRDKEWHQRRVEQWGGIEAGWNPDRHQLLGFPLTICPRDEPQRVRRSKTAKYPTNNLQLYNNITVS